MGLLRFSYGTMSSGKSTLALQIHHNLSKRSRRGMLLSLFDREGARVSSRLGVSVQALEVGPYLDLCALAQDFVAEHGRLDYVVCDEVQFYEVDQVYQLARIADDLDVDVYAFGLLTDFRGVLFDGTRRMFEVADERIELHVEARCWCGARATNNARLVNGVLVREGDTIVVGDTSAPDEKPLFGDVVTYELLCRRHFREGRVAP
jgi:thymidine kinase